MRELGVRRLIGPNASGGLRAELELGEFVVCDQFVDRTSGRADTFYEGPETTHVSAADPYCPDLRRILVETARELGIPVRDGGTVVVIQGPRFSTRAESQWFAAAGWDVVGMTQVPEAPLAREAVHDLHLVGCTGDRAQQPRAPRRGFLVIAGRHERHQRQRRVSQPAEAVIPVPRRADRQGDASRDAVSGAPVLARARCRPGGGIDPRPQEVSVDFAYANLIEHASHEARLPP
jgi:hypothetical protein